MVADELAARGAIIIDADVLAREVVEPGTPALCRDHRPVWCPGTQRRATRPEAQLAQMSSLTRSHVVISSELCTLPSELRPPSSNGAAGDAAVVVHVIPLLVETGQTRTSILWSPWTLIMKPEADLCNGFTR